VKAAGESELIYLINQARISTHLYDVPKMAVSRSIFMTISDVVTGDVVGGERSSMRTEEWTFFNALIIFRNGTYDVYISCDTRKLNITYRARDVSLVTPARAKQHMSEHIGASPAVPRTLHHRDILDASNAPRVIEGVRLEQCGMRLLAFVLSTCRKTLSA